MSRPLRIQYPGAHYHIMNRGLSKAAIFDMDDDYGMFMDALQESLAFFEVKLLAYCLMTNHYHLLIHTPKGNLSRFMRHLAALYTQRHNRLHQKDGPLFRGRYKAILVQEDAYLMHLVRYIHLNPIQANLADDLNRYRWSSHLRYLKPRDEVGLCVKEALSYFSKTPSKARKAYIAFIKDGVDPKTQAFFNLKKHSPIFGDDHFIDRIKDEFLLNNKPSTEISQARPMRGELIFSRILTTVARHFKIREEELYKSQRGQSNKPRSIAIALCRDLSAMSLPEIATHFKLGSYKTISAHHRRLIQSLSRDKKLARVYEDLKKVISK